MTTPTTNNYLSENVNSAEVEKHCPGPVVAVLGLVTLRLIHTPR